MPAAAAAAISAGATIFGSHQASNTAKRAQAIQSKTDDSTLALETRRDEEARRQWEADQQQRAKEFAASEEERAFNRQQAEIAAADRAYQQQLLREREQRAAPYRAMSQQALGNLGQLLGIDLSGSALNQNLSAPRSAAPASTPAAPAPRGGLTTSDGLPPGTMNLSAPVGYHDVTGPLPQAPTLGDLIQQQQRGTYV